MSSNYSKTVIFILLGSALLSHPRIHTSEKVPDMGTASRVIRYCSNIHCWQEKPCLEHQENATLLPSQQAKVTHVWPAAIVVMRRNPYPSTDRYGTALSLAPLPWSPT